MVWLLIERAPTGLFTVVPAALTILKVATVAPTIKRAGIPLGWWWKADRLHV